MGRWAQRRRGSSGPSPAAPPPPPPARAIVSATLNGIWTIRFVFDGPVAWNGNLSSSNLTAGFGFSTPDSGTQVTADTIDIHFGGPVNTGDSWDLSGPPSWADQVVTTPAGGTVG